MNNCDWKGSIYQIKSIYFRLATTKNNHTHVSEYFITIFEVIFWW